MTPRSLLLTFVLLLAPFVASQKGSAAYCNNQPIGNYDPIGLQSMDGFWTAEDELEYQQGRQRSRLEFATNHPWWARIFGIGNAVAGTFAVPVGLAGPEAQAQVFGSPFIAASTVTMGQPEDVKAIGSGLVTMAQDPFGQGQLFGTGLVMLTGPKFLKMPSASPAEGAFVRSPVVPTTYYPGELMPSGQLAGVGPGAMFVGEDISLFSRTEFNGTRVYQRSDLIDAAMVDARGRTNLERMQSGLAPIGPDGKSINLHHMLQTSDGPLAEITATFHQQNSSIIHINPNTIPSGVNRPGFDVFRRDYWMNRAIDFSP